MYGQKQIFTCLIMCLLVGLLNYFKTLKREEREHRQYMEQLIKRRQLEKERQEIAIRHEIFHKELMVHMLEYSDKCFDIHALIFRPHELDLFIITMMTNQNIENTKNNTILKDSDDATIISSTNILITEKKPNNCFVERGGGGDGGKFDSILHDHEEQQQIIINSKKSQIITPTTTREGIAKLSGSTISIIYVVVLILLLSLGKAAYDLSKQLKELAKTNTLTEDEMLRRCSLQEYSLIKHKQKKSTTKASGFEPLLKKKIITQQLSLDSSSKATQKQYFDFTRRMSTNPQDYSNGSGIITEPGTPAKPGKLLAGRPAPLLRRCSVPVFAVNQKIGQLRRPSMDSFSEDESSTPENNKRRVRMICRH